MLLMPGSHPARLSSTPEPETESQWRFTLERDGQGQSWGYLRGDGRGQRQLLAMPHPALHMLLPDGVSVLGASGAQGQSTCPAQACARPRVPPQHQGEKSIYICPSPQLGSLRGLSPWLLSLLGQGALWTHKSVTQCLCDDLKGKQLLVVTFGCFHPFSMLYNRLAQCNSHTRLASVTTEVFMFSLKGTGWLFIRMVQRLPA